MPVRSPYPDVDVPDVSLTEFVLDRAAELGDKPALIDGPSGRTLSYAGLRQAVDAVAAGLAARGFSKGDVFGVYSPNLPEYAAALHGVIRAGGIVTTSNPLSTPDELGRQLADAGARFLLTVPPFLDAARKAADQAGVEEVFVFGEADGATPFSALLESGEPPQVIIDPARDLAVLPYSSGTTGLPKGVMLTHRNLVANVSQSHALIRIDADDRLIGVLPFFHIYGLTVILNLALRAGATVVTMPRFDLGDFLSTLAEHRITRGFVVPPIVLALAKHPMVDDYDLSALEVVMSGAAPLSADLAEACAERLGCVVTQGYGLTETSPVTHVIPDDAAGDKPGSIGPVLPNTEARVVDLESGDDAGAGDDGEIWVRGPQVMAGYLNNPDATAATIDDDGWCHTGDVGHADDDGYFFVVDRVKELIKYKGYQVAPAELEALLITHPAVTDAAVIGAPDPEAGEVPQAFVVLGGDATAGQIMDFVAEQVAPHKKVRRVAFVDEIPKSASGKILRRELRERGG